MAGDLSVRGALISILKNTVKNREFERPSSAMAYSRTPKSKSVKKEHNKPGSANQQREMSNFQVLQRTKSYEVN